MSTKINISILLPLFLLFSACGGGQKTQEAVEENSAESEGEVSVPSESLDFEVADETPVTDAEKESVLLFDGFSSSSVVEKDEPEVLEFGEEKTTTSSNSGSSTTQTQTTNAPTTTAKPSKPQLVFLAPQDCKSTPTGGNAIDFVEALYRNCLYRPIVADNNQIWVKQINDGLKKPEEIRDISIYTSPESRCLRGEIAYKDSCPDSKVLEDAKGYEIFCDPASFKAPQYTARAAERLRVVCSNAK